MIVFLSSLRRWILIYLILVTCSCINNKEAVIKPELVDYVNPYMGNISHLLVPTFPTIHLPNSMLRVYPERADYTQDLLYGLPLITTSHRGSSAFNMSPLKTLSDTLNPVSHYSYDREKITPYSYQVYLDDANILVDYAVSHQSAKYRLTFEESEDAHVVLHSKNGALSWDGTAVSGYQLIENDTEVYVYIKPLVTPEHVSVIKEGIKIDDTSAEGHHAALVLTFHDEVIDHIVDIDYGVSFINTDQAKRNMLREVGGKTLMEVKNTGKSIWNQALGKIRVEGGSEDDKTVFYTSLYRCYERPVNISEDGRYYSAFDGRVHDDNGRAFYTDDWIWDSYRAHHPLRVLLNPDKEEDILNSFILMSEQMDRFWLPTFPEITGDSRRMNSNHGVASLLDGYRKGLRNFDLNKAYLAAKNAIMEKTLAPWSGMPAGELDDFYKEHGYIPALSEGEAETIPEVHPFESRQPIAVTLGTAYDEWCLSQLAKELKLDSAYHYFLKNAYNYRNVFNATTDFFHPKDKYGKFIEPFDYVFDGGMGARKFYGENNGWVYRWDVPHNVADLIELMGGRENFIHNLNQTFSEPLGMSKYSFYAKLPDHTGNVGQFSMANEPSLHIPYLYNYAGQPWKTQKRIRRLLKTWFRNDLMGVPGDEDGGGMSAFVVFSQMGFYPVTPGMPVYNIGSPTFDTITLELSNGKSFKINAKNYGPENIYIQSATLNGEVWNKPWFSHEVIEAGGVLELEMGDRANKAWGAAPEHMPPSAEPLEPTMK
ncbi:GH92 family glycosyl hydrolase [Aestuariivivens sediminicola]|uniref:GH92 family glycosyl hydrolase n=1 Tax=Aestuariivivens sediminicola TaxID=2913560 RepID=UPI001F566467|nr:GH92 family glycosyl hydrolase [Aestuariivivens sediminicola]